MPAKIDASVDVLRPRWIQDLERLLAIRSQFVFSGNIRDRFLTPRDGGYSLEPFLECLWQTLKASGFSCVMVFDCIDGITLYPPRNRALLERAVKSLDLNLVDRTALPCDIRTVAGATALLARIRRAVEHESERVAIVIDYASRITGAAQNLRDAEQTLFNGCEKLGHSVQALPRGIQDGRALFNPVIWLVNRSQDLPSWYVLDSEKVHSIEIAKPDYEHREVAAERLIGRFAGGGEATDEERTAFVRTFAGQTDGLTLQAMLDISLLARNQREAIAVDRVEDAIRCFKVGVEDNPWKKEHVRDRIRPAAQVLEKRVKGQRQAITKTVDILTRSVMGLTGAQARSSGSRPRGVLFFAGPTGVGKTELAKSLTELLFDDERAYIRFDMSEFADEHTSARLLGAPPGYVGYDAGGELTNAVRQRPFSVILFDEIEKAHPRLLDKFLQVLEDGRLTDGRGETIYFSEAVIIFTSNLGITVVKDGHRVANVVQSDSYDVVEKKVREAISDHFKFALARPEILNRIGDNIVVFNFIRREVAELIFDGMLDNVVKRVAREHEGMNLLIEPVARQKLLELCTKDLSNGGRGIGNLLETSFINPLARALFALPLTGRTSVAVTGLEESDNVYSLTLA